MTGSAAPEIEYIEPECLEPHPLNDKVYGDRTDHDQALLASVKEYGILEPIVADPEFEADGVQDQPTIISGHRRVEAAKEVGLEQVPVRFVRSETELDRQERLLTHNQTRDKSFSQKLREAKELERIERERARRRQGKRTDIVENSPQGEEGSSPADEEFGKARDKVAQTVGIGSGRTLDMAKKVWEAAQDGDTVAQHEVDKLDQEEQSIYGAYQKIRDRLQTEDQKESNDTGKPTSDGVEENSTSDGETEERVNTEDVIVSAHRGRNDEVFGKVLDLHVEPGSSIADVTYGEGVFWRQVSSGKYELTATDIDPSRSPDSAEGVDCRDLPYSDASLDCVVLDPPYAEGFYEPSDKQSDDDHWIKERYSGAAAGEQSPTYHDAVLATYSAAGEEAHRVLCDEGILIAKMQDEVSRNEQRLTHIEVTNRYQKIGFHAKDLFVVVRQDTPTVGRIYEQQRARKNHSYFMIYEKQ